MGGKGGTMSAKEAAPACPRCGYDQSGAVAAWGRVEPPQCPVYGVGNECGLKIRWADVFNPEHMKQTQLFEHARKRVALAAARTLGCCVRPGRLWRLLRMEHAIVWERLVPFAIIGLVMCAGAMFVALGRCAWVYTAAARAWIGPYNGFVGWSDARAFAGLTSRPPRLWLSCPQPPAAAAGPSTS